MLGHAEPIHHPYLYRIDELQEIFTLHRQRAVVDGFWWLFRLRQISFVTASLFYALRAIQSPKRKERREADKEALELSASFVEERINLHLHYFHKSDTIIEVDGCALSRQIICLWRFLRWQSIIHPWRVFNRSFSLSAFLTEDSPIVFCALTFAVGGLLLIHGDFCSGWTIFCALCCCFLCCRAY